LLRIRITHEKDLHEIQPRAFDAIIHERHDDYVALQTARALKQAQHALEEAQGDQTKLAAKVTSQQNTANALKELTADSLAQATMYSHGMSEYVCADIKKKFPPHSRAEAMMMMMMGTSSADDAPKAPENKDAVSRLISLLVNHPTIKATCAGEKIKLQEHMEEIEDSKRRIVRIEKAERRQTNKLKNQEKYAAIGIDEVGRRDTSGRPESDSESEKKNDSDGSSDDGERAMNGTVALALPSDDDEGDMPDEEDTEEDEEGDGSEEEPTAEGLTLLAKLREAAKKTGGDEPSADQDDESDSDSGVMEWDEIEALEREEGLVSGSDPGKGDEDHDKDKGQQVDGSHDSSSNQGSDDDDDNDDDDDDGFEIKKAKDTTGLLTSAIFRESVKLGQMNRGDLHRRLEAQKMLKGQQNTRGQQRDQQPRQSKNRMGQRQRQLLQKRMYGADARVIKEKRAQQRQQQKTENQGERNEARLPRKKEDPIIRDRKEKEEAKVSKATRMEKSERGNKQGSGETGGGGTLHPSWEAKKAAQKMVLTGTGKKVVFGDDGSTEVVLPPKRERPIAKDGGESNRPEKKPKKTNHEIPNTKTPAKVPGSGLHPSWEARKKATAGILPSAGKKITFD